MISVLTRGALTLFICVGLGGCAILDRGFLNPSGPVSGFTRHEFVFVCIVMLFVVVPVLLMAPLVAWHYRLSNTKSAYRPQWGFSWIIEGLIWLPPTGIVVLLGISAWRATHRLDPYRALPGQALDVQVVALDWKWLFIYPAEGIASVNALVIPAGQPVRFDLTSATVMQSLMIPRLAGQIYAMEGMQTHLNAEAAAPGVFFGENTQFNGEGFQNQKFQVTALDPQRWANWLAEAKANPRKLDAAAYEDLSRRSTLPRPELFGTDAPGLFEAILQDKQTSGHTLALKQIPPLSLRMEQHPHD